MSTAWEPDRRSNFFFSPPAHLCAITYMTEISLIVTLNNHFTLPYLTRKSTRCSYCHRYRYKFRRYGSYNQFKEKRPNFHGLLGGKHLYLNSLQEFFSTLSFPTLFPNQNGDYNMNRLKNMYFHVRLGRSPHVVQRLQNIHTSNLLFII